MPSRAKLALGGAALGALALSPFELAPTPHVLTAVGRPSGLAGLDAELAEKLDPAGDRRLVAGGEDHVEAFVRVQRQ